MSRHSKKETSQSSTSTPASTKSHVNYRYLSTPEKDQRLQELHTQYRCSAKKAKRLEEKLKAMIEEKGEVVDEGLNSDLKQIMHDCSEKVSNEHPEGSLLQVFWEQQLKATSCADKRQMRWHPVMVKWCLYLRHQSRSVYWCPFSTLPAYITRLYPLQWDNNRIFRRSRQAAHCYSRYVQPPRVPKSCCSHYGWNAYPRGAGLQ